MSQRSIIEINHDRLAGMTSDDWESIKRICLHHPDVRGIREVNGARVLLQRHHTTTVWIETEFEKLEVK